MNSDGGWYAPLMDKRVEIHGTSRADMNGKRGTATDFHPIGGLYSISAEAAAEAYKYHESREPLPPHLRSAPPPDSSKWRYTVQLDSGETFKLKPVNVRAEVRVRRG